MPAYKITEVELDPDITTLEDDDDYDELMTKLDNIIKRILIVDSEEELWNAVADSVAYESYDILSMSYEQVSSVEVTVYGLFGGETNTTDKRFEVPILGKKTDLAIIRAVKSELGWNNIPCIKQDYGDSIRLEPRGILQCADIETVY
jgi:hypothetical protein